MSSSSPAGARSPPRRRSPGAGCGACPYVLVVESHDEGPRAGWRRAVKGAVVPRVVRGASGVLVTGTLARRSMVGRGARARARARLREHDRRRRVRRAGRPPRCAHGRALRESLGAGPRRRRRALGRPARAGERVSTSSSTRSRRRATRDSSSSSPATARSGSGSRISRRCAASGSCSRATSTGSGSSRPTSAADVFALLSEREPWAVVVNEAAACGLPLVLSDRVGAAHDLLRDGENGALVPAGRRRRRRPTPSGGSPPTPAARRLRRPLARARARLGLRPERRGLPGGGPRGRRVRALAVALPCARNGARVRASSS